MATKTDAGQGNASPTAFLNALQPYRRIDAASVEQRVATERPPVGIRWWTLPVALALCAGQSVFCLYFETHGNIYLIATQISVIAFAFLFILSLAVNPLLRLTRLVRPFNRAEMMAIFAALFVSGGISSFGMTDHLLPMIAAPFNSEWNTPQSGRPDHLVPNLNPHLYITDPNVIREFRIGFDDPTHIWGRIPWRVWMKPIACWMIFVLAMYGLYYAIAMIFFRSWSAREKIVFPLARVPEAALPADGAPGGALPAIMRLPLFWIGFLLSFLTLGYNGLCQAEWIRGMTPLSLGVRGLPDLLKNSVFKGLAEPGGFTLSLMISFTTLGIAFLLPLEISLSVWVYQVVMLAAVMVGIWMAFFPSAKAVFSNLEIESSFVSSLGGGALFGLAAVMVAKIVWEKWQDAANHSGADVTVWQRLRSVLGPGMLLLATCAAIILAWLKWSGVDFGWAVIYLGVIILMLIGLIRTLAESGIYNQQVHTGPAHLLGLTGGQIVPGGTLAALVPIHAIFFFDMKTFMGPNVMNSFKMEEETRASRRMYHLIVIAGIVATIVVSMTALLYFAYSLGANRAGNWFFTGGPNRILNNAARLAAEGGGGHSPELWWFYAGGAVWAIGSLLLRRKVFWWLHPIGLVMTISPLARIYWLSFFIGWLCKRIAVRYGGRHMFAQLRPAFIGLIFGELIACFIWAVLKYAFDLPYVSIHINN